MNTTVSTRQMAPFAAFLGLSMFLSVAEGEPKAPCCPTCVKKVVSEVEAPKDTKSEAVKKTAPKAVTDLFGSELKDAKGKIVSVDALADKVIGVYFSAHWCPPCRAFTPKLVAFHKEMTKADRPFEIVFVSSDRSSKDMYGYMTGMKMPWLALPYGDKRKGALSGKFKVRGIPKLVILSPTGALISENGRGEVMRGAAVFDEWQAAKK